MPFVVPQAADTTDSNILFYCTDDFYYIIQKDIYNYVLQKDITYSLSMHMQ